MVSEAEWDVVGLGNAIVDLLVRVDEPRLAELGLAKGTMSLVDEAEAVRLTERFPGAVTCSGGSAANTMAGVASLGGRAAYIGKVREDDLGRAFAEDIRRAGVHFATPPAAEGPATARCIVLVTPDGQRTMQTFLGASTGLGPGDVDERLVRASRVTYLEGYLWDPPQAKEAFVTAARAAHEAGRLVALSLSDPICVERHRDSFRDLVGGHVDVLFANEEEIRSLFETDSFDEAAAQAAATCRIAALTRGPRGSVVLWEGTRHDIPAEPVPEVVDTTGAGDLYAAGFLYGLTRGWDAERCGRLGGLAAAAVLGSLGARPGRTLAPLASRMQR
ncbi:MAG: adenosine kinase [Acidobacteria bacterium]|nr:MAG: adenosine kinase [Acidobacteriota bacterium]